MANAVSDILICPRAATNSYVRVGAAELQCSWEINQPGALSCRVPLADLRAAGLTGNLIGWWIRYEHPKQGAWGGVVMQVGYQDGVVEFAASSFMVLARARLIKLIGVLDDVGAIVKRVIAYADSSAPATGLIVKDANIQLGGGQIATNFDRNDLLNDVMPLLTDQSGYSWNVDADRNVYFWKNLVLAQATPTATLAEQVEITQAHWVDDLSTVYNHLFVDGQELSSKTKRGKKAGNASMHDLNEQERTDQPSIDAYGLLEEKIDLSPVTTQRDLNNYADLQKALLAVPSAAVTLTVADKNTAWDDVREGAVLRLRLGLEGIDGMMVVESRALDVAAGTLTVSGSAVRVS